MTRVLKIDMGLRLRLFLALISFCCAFSTPPSPFKSLSVWPEAVPARVGVQLQLTVLVSAGASAPSSWIAVYFRPNLVTVGIELNSTADEDEPEKASIFVLLLDFPSDFLSTLGLLVIAPAGQAQISVPVNVFEPPTFSGPSPARLSSYALTAVNLTVTRRRCLAAVKHQRCSWRVNAQ